MLLRLFMDHHVPGAITRGLRLRGVDVLTAEEDNSHELLDPLLLDRATELNRVLFTQDRDFLIEAAYRQRRGIPFVGIVYGHQNGASISTYIADLEIVVSASDLAELQNSVTFLPL